MPTSSTTIAAYMPTLKTSAVLGGPENLWLLRRGLLSSGAATPSAIDPADRIRMVQTFDPGAGRVVVDRNWRNPMQPDELADFTHLHPQQELHQSVMAGLRRCYLQELVAATLTSQYGDIDLTYQYPWLTNPDQVTRCQYGWNKPWADTPFHAYMQQGHVLLGGTSGPYLPANLWVTALRPAWSWVNAADSTTGPTADSDVLSVDLDYAAAGGHIEAWHLFPSHLFAAAAGNLQATQEMAAREFTRQSMIWGPELNRRIGFSEVVGPTSTVAL